MTTHDLKCWPQFFEAILCGDKTFEVRKNDRDFQVGDLLRLREYQPGRNYCAEASMGYTGNVTVVKVTYILHGAKDSPTGLPEGVCVMAIKI